MNFGKIPEENWPIEVDRCEASGGFALPDDHAQTAKILKAGGRGGGELGWGGTTWNVRAWRGSVYPEKTPKRLWPEHYGRTFTSIEFNATHYRIYSPEKMAEWAEAVPEGFKFCPKIPAIISRYRRFNNCEGPTDDFIEGLLALGNKLGTSFIQLTPQYAPKHAEKLRSYLEAWPRELPLCVEFRHPDWFTGGAEAERVWALMEACGIGSVLTDTALRRDALHMRLSAAHTMVRFGGYAGHPSDERRLEDWGRRIKHWSSEGLDRLDFLVHQPDSVFTPQTCTAFKKKFASPA